MKLLHLVDDAALQDLHVVGHRTPEREPDMVADLVMALILPKVFIIDGLTFDAKEGFPDFDDFTAWKSMCDTLKQWSIITRSSNLVLRVHLAHLMKGTNVCNFTKKIILIKIILIKIILINTCSGVTVF